MIYAVFDENDRYKVAAGLWQYAFGQSIMIQGLKLPPAVSVDFSYNKTGLDSVPRIGVTKDGVTEVPIPDDFLINGDTTADYTVYAFISIIDDKTGNTEYRIDLPIKARPKPKTDNKNPEDTQIFREAMKAVNDSAVKAKESETNAQIYAEQTRQDATKTDTDRKAVEELVKQTSDIGAQVEEVKKHAQTASESANNAKMSETNAKESETNAKASETNASTSAQKAQTAESNAKQAETGTLETEKRVNKVAGDVGASVEAFNKSVLEANTALNQKASGHITSIEQAGTGAKASVTNEGTKQTGLVQTAGTAEVKKVTDEGSKQVALVKKEGEGFVADRKQIQTNKMDIGSLKEDLTKLDSQTSGIQSALISQNASGNIIQVKDSAKLPIKNLRLLGKSTQNGVPTPTNPIPIVSIGDKGNINVDVSGKNLLPFPYPFFKEIGVTKEYRGVKYTINSDKSVHLEGTPTNTIGMNICAINFGAKYGKVVCSDSIFYDNNNNMTFFYFGREAGQKIDKIIYPQVERGTLATAYEPYKEPQIIALSTPNGLASVNSVHDEITMTERIQLIGQIASYNNEPITTDFMSSTGQLTVGAQVNYVLPEPIVTPLTPTELEEIKKIHTNYPSTVISNDENCDMELEYTVDTKSYVDKKIAEIIGAVIAQKGA